MQDLTIWTIFTYTSPDNVFPKTLKKFQTFNITEKKVTGAGILQISD